MSTLFSSLIGLTMVLLLLLLVGTIDGGPISASSCLSSEASILLRIKEDLRLSNGRLNSWVTNGSNDCCKWEGVACDPGTGHVIELQLRGGIIADIVDIAGSRIPPSLCELHRLERLELSDCDFNGSAIPSKLAHLTRLTHLNLSYSWFSGRVPHNISSLSDLVSLDLTLPSLDLEDLEGFVQNFKNLEYLNLSIVRIKLSDPQKWGISLSSALPNLRSLNLAFCDLKGSLPSHMFKFPYLQALDLSNNLDLNGKLMPSFFSPESNLQSLRLHFTNLSGSLPPTIGDLTALTFLDLSFTYLSGSLPPTIGNLTALTYLNLKKTNLSGILESSCFVNLTQLTYLDLSENMVSGSLPSLPQYLRTIDLHSNNFSGPIPNSYNFFKLEFLDLSDNSLTGTIPSSLINGPSSVQSPLQYLDLSNNKFDGYLDLGIFSNFKKLSLLSLSGNNFTVDVHNPTLEFPSLQELWLVSCNINQFPQFLRHHKPIDILDLSNNRITGEIPKWLTSIEQGVFLNVTIVDLSFNMLNSLPNSLFPSTGSFTKLKYFSISNNYVTGEIPASLCNFTKLSLLDLSNNKLTGQIPECLFNLTNLVGVMLQNNQLQGQIPEFNNSTKELLGILDLSRNRLEGYIPRSLGYCKDLELINFGDNKLTGRFPSWLGKLPNLRVLVLRSNSLSGAIDFTFNQNDFQELLLLDISTNQFTGQLPPGLLLGLNAMKIFNNISTIPNTFAGDYVIEWKVIVDSKGTKLTYERKASIMTMIDFSNNYFEGDILEEIGDLNGLQALKLSQNKLKWPIPKSIGSLGHLESLDLSHNCLSGEIPKELATLNFLGYLNLSYNNLSGRIPQSPHFSTFDVPSFKGNPSLCGPPLSLPCEANNTTILVPFVGLRGEDEEKMWKYISIGLGFGVGFGTAISFSYFLNNGRSFNSFWRRCYWSYA